MNGQQLRDEVMQSLALLPEREGLTMAEAFELLPAPIRQVLRFAAERAEDQWGGDWRDAALFEQRLDEAGEGVRDALQMLRRIPGEWTF